ncbi:hypothetical protein LBMAG38_00820 [Chloroflexota bacterium]|nr:hypothetical protein LBMAG38_00820 [Chloroflexota bacterium]
MGVTAAVRTARTAAPGETPRARTYPAARITGEGWVRYRMRAVAPAAVEAPGIAVGATSPAALAIGEAHMTDRVRSATANRPTQRTFINDIS